MHYFDRPEKAQDSYVYSSQYSVTAKREDQKYKLKLRVLELYVGLRYSCDR